jgi:hypothetical protein
MHYPELNRALGYLDNSSRPLRTPSCFDMDILHTL